MHQMPCTRYEARNTIYDKKEAVLTTKDDNNQGHCQYFADQVPLVENMVQKQQEGHGKGQVPSAIMHTEEQLMDIKRFCCSGDTVLGSDKTDNLGDIFVTAGVSSIWL